VIEYIKLAGVDIWVYGKRAWGWYSGTKTLDGRLSPEFFKENYNYRRANADQLEKFIIAVFRAKDIVGWK